MSIRMRQFVERHVIGTLVTDLLAAGYSITVDNGENEEVTKSTSYTAIMNALDTTDEDFLRVFKREASQGWVRCIYGNNGPDVISDYTTNLERFMKRSQKVADYWDADGPFVSPPATIVLVV